MTLIKLDKLSKTYKMGSNSIVVLKEICFELQHGEMKAIMGASGSGKTTLMNIIGMMDQATSGNYFFLHQNVSFLKPRELAEIRNKKIGFVFQSFFLLARQTVLQNVMLPLFYRNILGEEAKEKAMMTLKKIKIDKLATYYPSQLSGGQQQRVAIARALVGNPDIILADEPTGALDSETSKEIMKIFLELNYQEGRSILIITHDKEVSLHCQNIVKIKDGLMLN